MVEPQVHATDPATPAGHIRAASLKGSPRLQRMLKLLSDGQEHSTRDIVHGADVCAVNTAAAELRRLGFPVHCHKEGTIWVYHLGEKL